MIRLEKILGKEPREIPFYKELQAITGEIDDLKTDAEKGAAYLTLAEACRIFSHDGVREDMKKLAEYFAQESEKYSAKES